MWITGKPYRYCFNRHNLTITHLEHDLLQVNGFIPRRIKTDISKALMVTCKELVEWKQITILMNTQHLTMFSTELIELGPSTSGINAFWIIFGSQHKT